MYSKMDWDDIEQHYKHFNDDWGHYPKRYCISSEKPEQNVIEEEYQISPEDREDWKQSVHPFCKSCFAVYKNVCTNVGVVFGLGQSWKKEDLPDKVLDYMDMCSLLPSQDQIVAYERVLRALAECISARWYHHKACYFSNTYTYTYTYNRNHTIEIANPSHERFMLILIRQLSYLYRSYKGVLYQVNESIQSRNIARHSNTPLVENKFVIEFPHLLDICRSLMKRLGTKEDYENAKRVFVTDSALLSNKSSKKKQQSRVNSSYKLPNIVIDTITQKYLSEEERNADDSKFRLSNKKDKQKPKKKSTPKTNRPRHRRSI